MNPAHRFVPTFRSRGVQFGSICSRSPSLLRYLLCRALRARLLIHFTQFLPQLHQLAELLPSRKRCIDHLLCGGWPRSFLAHRRALFNYDVESGVPGNTRFYIVVEKGTTVREEGARPATTQQVINAPLPTGEELRQLMQLRQELSEMYQQSGTQSTAQQVPQQ